MDLRPDYANVLREGIEEKVDPEEVEVGETIIIRPGEKIPLDGVILEGSTAVNTAALTGESLPQDKAEGDPVVSGTVNLTGVITVQTQSAYGESTAAKILELVENAADQKARVESFITRFAHWYTPCVVIGAALLAVIPPLFFSQSWGTWVERALVFLVVSCPCALVVSVPLTFFGGIGGASRCGILVKGAGYMETLAKAKTVVFDKTGTLTKGSPYRPRRRNRGRPAGDRRRCRELLSSSHCPVGGGRLRQAHRKRDRGRQGPHRPRHRSRH